MSTLCDGWWSQSQSLIRLSRALFQSRVNDPLITFFSQSGLDFVNWAQLMTKESLSVEMLKDIGEGADIDGDDEFDYGKHVTLIASTLLDMNHTTKRVCSSFLKIRVLIFDRNNLPLSRRARQTEHSRWIKSRWRCHLIWRACRAKKATQSPWWTTRHSPMSITCCCFCRTRRMICAMSDRWWKVREKSLSLLY